MSYTLFSDGLLSKWGFHDGGQFDDFEFEYSSPDGPDAKTILVAAVKAYLVPQLKQSVNIVEIITSHNPIRANTVDGREVDWYNDNPTIKLEPKSVEVSDEELFALFPGAFRNTAKE